MNDIIDLGEDFFAEKRNLYQDSLSETINVLDYFQNLKSILDFPFHLNIIDELRANENAHSRILAKIFQYSNNNNYPFLESFLENIEIDRNIKKPKVTVEKHKIDILICDENFVLIIENKINYAADQPEQLKKYFDRVNENYNYKKEHIFLLYLTRWGMKKPSYDSLPIEYRDFLDTNYKEIDFLKNILPWLEEKVLPECRLKEKILSSAILQYIDHLKGIFNKRENMKQLDEKLKEFLKEKLNIKKELTTETFAIIDGKLQELEACKNYIDNIKIDFRNDLRETFKRKLYEKFKDEWVCVSNAKSGIVNIDEHVHDGCFGFRWDKGPFLKSVTSGNNLYLHIEFHAYWEVFCGLYPCEESNELREKLKTLFDEKSIELEKGEHFEKKKYPWIFYHLDGYKYSEIARYLYNDSHNNLFIEKMDNIVEDFYNKFSIVANSWKNICNELKGEINMS